MNLAREIKTTLALDGEKKFKEGIKAVEQELRVMTSQLGAAASAYGSHGATLKQINEKQKLVAQQTALQRVKQEALNGAVKDAQSAFNAASKEAAELAEKYGTNSAQAQAAADKVAKAEKTLNDYKIQANNAQKALNKLEAAQKAAAKETFEKLTAGLKSVTQAAGKAAANIAKVASQSLESSVNSIAKGFTAYATAAVGAGTAVFMLSSKSAAAADDINTMSKVTGLSTVEIQKMQYATALIDVDLETVTSSMGKLIKNMSTAQKGTGDAANAFKSLGISITDQDGSLRNNQEVFNEAIEKLGTIENTTQRDAYAMQIFGKSAQELNPLIMGGAEQLAALGESAEKTGMILSQDALDNLNSFNDSLDVAKANANAAGKSISGNFAGPLKKITDTIGSKIPSLTDGFNNLFQNGDNGQLTQGLTGMIQNITSSVSEMAPQMIQTFNGLILSIVSSITASLPQITTTILPELMNGFQSLINGLIQQIPVLVPALIDGGIALFTGLLDSLNNVIEKLIPMLPDLITKICDTLIENLPSIIETGFNILIGLITGIANAIPTLIEKIVEMIPVIITAITENLPAIIEAGISIIVALAQGLPQAIPAIIKAIPDIIVAIIKAFTEVDWLDLGVQILKGIAEGLIEGVKAIADTIGKVASSVITAFKNFFGIHSPSRLFRDEVGKFLALGIGEGFVAEMSAVSKNMQNAVPREFDVVTGKRTVTSSNLINTSESTLAVDRNNRGDGTVNIFKVNIDAHNVRDFVDIVNVCKNAQQRARAR